MPKRTHGTIRIRSRGSIRHEVFTRRGGLYFGTMHLLAYDASYNEPIYRFADFNAGRYASRNAAFQHAVSKASGIALALDGDLLIPDAGRSEPAGCDGAGRAQFVRSAAHGRRRPFIASWRRETASISSSTTLYRGLFALADSIERKPMPRAVLPGIDLKSPKITRRLTTAWFANRVDQRFQQCMRRAATR